MESLICYLLHCSVCLKLPLSKAANELVWSLSFHPHDESILIMPLFSHFTNKETEVERDDLPNAIQLDREQS